MTRDDVPILLRSLSRRKLLGYGLVVAGGSAITGLLAACSSIIKPSSGASQSASNATLVVGVPAAPSTADPELGATLQDWELPMSVNELMLDYKFVPGDQGVSVPDLTQFEPKLAESWEYTNGGKTLRFHLRHGVKSEFGNELTSADVKWAWDRAYALAAMGIFTFTSGGVTGASGIHVVDKYTIDADLTKANNQNLLYNLANPNPGAYAVDSTVAKQHATTDDPWARAWFATHSATFGPYKITQWQSNVKAVLERNPNYYGRKPYFAKVVYQGVPDSSARLQLLERGEIQIAESLDRPSLRQLAGQAGVKVIALKGNNGLIFALNEKFPPFDNVKVRQAIAYASPIDQIISTVYFNDPTVRLLKGFSPEAYPAHLDYDPYYPQDLTKAKQLLQEAGVGNFQFPLDFQASLPEHEKAAVIIQSALKGLGITVELNKLTDAQWSETFFGKKAPALLDEDVAWNPDPGYCVSWWLPERAQDWINYSDPQGVALVNATLNAGPNDEVAAGKAAYKYIVDTAGWEFVIGTGFHLAMRDNIAGLHYRNTNMTHFQELSQT